EALLHKVRLLRSAPASQLTVLDFDQRAGRTHAGMRLEWPFVLGLDHLGGVLERVVDIAVFLFDAALAHISLADVVIERGLFGEWVRYLRPFYLQLLRGLNGIPFLVGHYAEEALVPDHFRARNILDRAFIDFGGHAAGDCWTDHPSMRHSRHLDVGNEVFLR